jgi:hypothetical protein
VTLRFGPELAALFNSLLYAVPATKPKRTALDLAQLPTHSDLKE